MNIHKNARLTYQSRVLLVERVLNQGWSVRQATAAVGTSERTGWKWLRRFRDEGAPGLTDRSSRPRRLRTIPNSVRRRIARLRRARLTCRRIARQVRRSVATVARQVKALGLSRLRFLDPAVPTTRYEKQRPGELLHVDIKRLARIEGIGHRITGSPRRRHNGAGYEFAHVCIDDHSRLAYVEILGDQRGSTAAAFLRRALAWFASLGVMTERVMTDNGGCYRSSSFAAVFGCSGLRHVRTRPYTPRTNGKAERLIQTLLREWAYRFPFRSSAQRIRLLTPYLHFYNCHRAHTALADRPPISRLSMNNLLRRDT